MRSKSPSVGALHVKRSRPAHQHLYTPTMSIERISHDPNSNISHHALVIHNQMPMWSLFSTSLDYFNGNLPMINHFNDVLKKFIIRRFHHHRLRSSASASSSTSSNISTQPRRYATITNRTSSSNDSVKRLFDVFNAMYIRGRIPNQNRSNLHPFDGFITDDLAIKITMWLARMPESQCLSTVQRLFDTQQTSPVAKIVQFLRRCGIATETVHGQTKIKREQTLDLLMVMTYLLQAAGYSNAYFVAV